MGQSSAGVLKERDCFFQPWHRGSIVRMPHYPYLYSTMLRLFVEFLANRFRSSSASCSSSSRVRFMSPPKRSWAIRRSLSPFSVPWRKHRAAARDLRVAYAMKAIESVNCIVVFIQHVEGFMGQCLSKRVCLFRSEKAYEVIFDFSEAALVPEPRVFEDLRLQSSPRRNTEDRVIIRGSQLSQRALS